MNILLFFLRRFLFAVGLMFIRSLPILQIFIMQLTSLYLLVFQFKYKPHDSTITQIFEIYNEITILCVSYCLIPFGIDYFDDSNK